MRHLRWAVLAVLAVGLCAAPVAAAHDHKDGGAVVAPAEKVAGLTGDELLGESWVQTLSHPAGTFTGGCTPVVHKVVSPEPDANFNSSCTITKGTSLFIPVGSDCSNVEPDPFFGADEAAQRDCAIAADEFFVTISIAVDGGEPVDTRNPRFELLSPQRTVELPEGNLFEVPAGPATFVAHGWGALVKRLSAGEHTITVVVTDFEGGTTTGTISVEVVRRGHCHGDRGHHGHDGHHGNNE
jgi:hypothetical protein